MSDEVCSHECSDVCSCHDDPELCRLVCQGMDPGTVIGGELEDKLIEIAASSEVDGPSTDTLSWTGMDWDQWIDGEQSPPEEEGEEEDDFGGWEENVKCWWHTDAGKVTQHSFTTTWTAPYEQGVVSYIEISVIDLPKEIPAGESGDRDDPGRRYFGTPDPVKPKAVWVGDIHINDTPMATHGQDTRVPGVNFDFNGSAVGARNKPLGNGHRLGPIDPDDNNSNGFHKKSEIVGVADPRPQVDRHWFGIEQFASGYVHWTPSNADDWDFHMMPDPPGKQLTQVTGSGKCFSWDAPGVKFDPEWDKRTRSGHRHNDATRFEMNVTFSNLVYWHNPRTGVWHPCSRSFYWDRDIVLNGTAGQSNWIKPPARNN